jgi:hypothetical protein
LILFAASNDGEGGYGTIQPESSSKNVVAVGATRTAASSLADYASVKTTEGKMSLREKFCLAEGMSEEDYNILLVFVEACQTGVSTDEEVQIEPSSEHSVSIQ